MSDSTHWPKDEVASADERTTLLRFLYHQRRFLLRKVEDLTEEQARLASCPPSDITLLGLIRHAAEVERRWAQRAMAGHPVEEAPLLYSHDAHPDGDPDGDLHPPADATLAAAVATLRHEIDSADATYARFALDDVERSERSFYTLRWILVHLIEEYARHCGHADLVREAIDGRTGE